MQRRAIFIWSGLLALSFVAGFFTGKPGRGIAPSGDPAGSAAKGPGSLIGSPRPGSGEPVDETVVIQIPVPLDRRPESVALFARDTLAESNRVSRMSSLMGLIENMTEKNWREVMQAFIDEREIHGRNHHSEWNLFAEKAGEVAGEEVVGEFFEKDQLGAVRAALAGWAKSDSKAALDWAETVPDPDYRDKIWGSLVIGIGQTDPDLSLRLLEQLPLENRITYLSNLMPTILQTAGPVEGAQVFNDAVSRAEERGEDGGSDYLKRLFATLANQRITNSKLPGKGEWAERHLGKPYVADYFITKTAKNIARDNPQEALDWLEQTVSSEDAAGAFPDLVKDWISFRGTEDLAGWLQQNPQHRDYDPIAVHFAERLVETDAAAAMRWAATVQDAELRDRALRVIGEANRQ